MSVQDSGLIENLDEISTQVPVATQTADEIPVVTEELPESDIPLFEEAEASSVDIPVVEGGETD